VNRQIARLALVGVGLVTALIVATTYWQTWATASLADRQDNEIQRVAQFSVRRGVIRAADGTILAANRIKKVPGVVSATVSFESGTAVVRHDAREGIANATIQAVRDAGFDAEVRREPDPR